MNIDRYHRTEEQPRAVDNLRHFLIESADAQDITGPIRIAKEHQQELLIDGLRLLLMPIVDYESYDEHFTRAGITKIEKDEAHSSEGVVAARVPRDARTITQIWNVHPSNRAILEEVFEMAGAMVRILGEKTGEIPDSEDFRLRKLLALRNSGKVTMLPPVEFIPDTDHNRLSALNVARGDLASLRDPFAEEIYINKIKIGLMNDSNGSNQQSTIVY